MAKKNSAEKAPPLQFKLVRIELMKSSTDKIATFHQKKATLNYNFEANFRWVKNTTNLIITTNYGFVVGDEEIFSMEVDNEFELLDVDKIFDQTEARVKKFLAYLLDVSIKHMRGIQSQLLNKTALQGYFIPNINASNFDFQLEKSPMEA